VCVERRSSPNDGLRTLDAPVGTAAGGLSSMVPWAAARMLAYERPIRLNEGLYITNECMRNWKRNLAHALDAISLLCLTKAEKWDEISGSWCASFGSNCGGAHTKKTPLRL
jgi:hypothetical protein